MSRLQAWIPRLEAISRSGISESTFGRYLRAGLLDWRRDAEDGTVRVELESLDALVRALATCEAENVGTHARLTRLAELTGRQIDPSAKLSQV